MDELVIRPSMKLIRASYTVVFIVIFVCVLAWVNVDKVHSWPPWVLLIPALLLIFPLRNHIRRNYTKITVLEDKLRFETGMLSRTTRNLQISKIQDVRVDQTLGQRLLGTGNLSIETAGETSQLTMENIDDPQSVADTILKAATQFSKGKPA